MRRDKFAEKMAGIEAHAKRQGARNPRERKDAHSRASKKGTWTAEDVRHFVRCADINLDNLLVQVPMLKDLPMFKIVKQQLHWALHAEEEDKSGACRT